MEVAASSCSTWNFFLCLTRVVSPLTRLSKSEPVASFAISLGYRICEWRGHCSQAWGYKTGLGSGGIKGAQCFPLLLVSCPCILADRKNVLYWNLQFTSVGVCRSSGGFESYQQWRRKIQYLYTTRHIWYVVLRSRCGFDSLGHQAWTPEAKSQSSGGRGCLNTYEYTL
jgi:hypothetical protein